jgi:hypothetical protein
VGKNFVLKMPLRGGTAFYLEVATFCALMAKSFALHLVAAGSL